MELLTPFQQEVLRAIGRSPLRESFYLTGGTALSAFYLKHRYSEDLAFFTPDPTAVPRAVPTLKRIAIDLDAEITFTRTLGSFLECFLQQESGERIKLDFAQDAPFRLEPTILNEVFRVFVDNATDISCNKLSALFDRAEPKDYVDVYFICRELMSFDELEGATRQKHVGIDDYWLAVALRRVEGINLLPRMVKALSLDDMRDFFLHLARTIMMRINSSPKTDSP